MDTDNNPKSNISLGRIKMEKNNLHETVIPYFLEARDFIISEGFEWEIDVVDNRCFEDQTPLDFYWGYVYVVLNSGMKNQIAEKIMEKFYKSKDLQDIGHPEKRKAIEKARDEYVTWFADLKTAEDKISYLETLPWIGPITKYHLARNLGLDFCKPDRHLSRVSTEFGFKDPHEMCRFISEKLNIKIGTVDLIIWRYCNLKG